MKDKIVNIIKKYWVIPASVLLWCYPIMPVGLGMCSVFILTIGHENLSIFLAMVGTGVVSSILIIFKLKKASCLSKRKKNILTFISILLFTLISYVYVGVVMM